MPGKAFTPKLPSFFDNVVRQTKVSTANGTPNPLNQFRKDDKVTDEYWWQIRKDDLFETIRTTIPGNDKFVPAHYNSLMKK